MSTSSSSTRAPMVSVVVPFTYERDLIAKCLESIRRQSIQEMEIICVDNHADPETRKHVDLAARCDRRLVVVECKAQGAGPARNKGLQVARGKYVIFVDADDFLYDAASIRSLYEAAESTKADLARGNVYVWWAKAGSYCALETLGVRIWFTRQALTRYEKEPLLWLPVQHQAYLFNRDFLTSCLFSYPRLLRGQDQPFLMSVLLSSTKVVVTDRPTYVYRKGHKVHDLLAEPRNYLDRMISIQMIKSTLLRRRLEVQWHLVFARMAGYMERATCGFPQLRTTDVMGVIQDIVRGLDRFGKLDYRPYTLGSAGQSLLKYALSGQQSNSNNPFLHIELKRVSELQEKLQLVTQK